MAIEIVQIAAAPVLRGLSRGAAPSAAFGRQRAAADRANQPARSVGSVEAELAVAARDLHSCLRSCRRNYLARFWTRTTGLSRHLRMSRRKSPPAFTGSPVAAGAPATAGPVAAAPPLPAVPPAAPPAPPLPLVPPVAPPCPPPRRLLQRRCQSRTGASNPAPASGSMLIHMSIGVDPSQPSSRASHPDSEGQPSSGSSGRAQSRACGTVASARRVRKNAPESVRAPDTQALSSPHHG